MWLNRWNYLETIQPAQETNQRDKTFLLVLERILEVGPDTELVSAVVRLSDLVLPSMVEEKDPVVRRKQELLSNTVRHKIITNSLFILCVGDGTLVKPVLAGTVTMDEIPGSHRVQTSSQA